jgi:hypothetical protein
MPMYHSLRVQFRRLRGNTTLDHSRTISAIAICNRQRGTQRWPKGGSHNSGKTNSQIKWARLEAQPTVWPFTTTGECWAIPIKLGSDNSTRWFFRLERITRRGMRVLIGTLEAFGLPRWARCLSWRRDTNATILPARTPIPITRAAASVVGPARKPRGQPSEASLFSEPIPARRFPPPQSERTRRLFRCAVVVLIGAKEKAASHGRPLKFGPGRIRPRRIILKSMLEVFVL